MRVLFTTLNTRFASDELAAAYNRVVDDVCRIAKQYERRRDDRTLVIVLTCPCCENDPAFKAKKAVLVSPFRGMKNSAAIATPKLFPPLGNPGNGKEASSDEEFVSKFQEAIERALAKNIR